MKSGRDRWIAAAAVIVVAVIAVLVVRTVFDARSRGRRALERNQETVVSQMAASMDRRIQSTLETFSGLGLQSFTLEVSGSSDAEALGRIQALIPDARTGMLLVRSDGVLTNGTLLRDPSTIGTKLDRAGLAAALETGAADILPAAPGLTTDFPAIAFVEPVRDASGRTTGAFVFESEIAADDDFNLEIGELHQGRTGRFTFVDELGTVIASSDPSTLGEPLDDDRLTEAEAGLHREGGLVIGVGEVPTAGWRLIFTQDEQEFEAGLGQRLQSALLLLIVLTLLGGAAGFIGILRRLRAEREERRRLEELSETREEFISIVSHELRTPVAGVAGFLQTCLDHWDSMSDSDRRHAVARAGANAQRLQALTRDVLDTTSVERGDLSYSFDVLDLGREVEVAVMAVQDIQPDRPFSLSLPDQTVWARADADRIQQVLLNLLDNAMKNSPRDRGIEIEMTLNDDDAEVSVTDHGPGLSTEQREQVFDKFVRGRSSVRGTGLGLFISSQIIQAHGGRIWVASPEGKGATFAFTVPLAPAPVEPVSG